MAGNKQLKRRINSANNISQITRAMEAVAASKMRKAQTVANSGEPYQKTLSQLTNNLAKQLNPKSHPLLKVDDEQAMSPKLYIIISSDRGLCGGFNSNLFRLAEQTVAENDPVILLGKKINIYTHKTGWKTVGSISPLGDAPTYNAVKPVGMIATEEFLGKRISGVTIIYQKFINTLIQTPTVDQILPVKSVDAFKSEKEITQNYIFEPNRSQLLNDVLPYYIYLSIYQAVLSSKAAEQSARMVAMKSASDNAHQVKYDLQLVYNRERQRVITSEISDVVIASMALQK